MKTVFCLFIGVLFGMGCSSGNGEAPAQDTLDSVAVDTPKMVERTTIVVPAPNVAYTYQFKALCDESKGILLPVEEVRKHGKRKPYNFIRKEKNDSLILSFEIIHDCGMEYAGDVHQSNDSLFLGYFPPRDSIRLADCYCSYLLTYRIAKDTTAWKSISVSLGHAWWRKEEVAFAE